MNEEDVPGPATEQGKSATPMVGQPVPCTLQSASRSACVTYCIVHW